MYRKIIDKGRQEWLITEKIGVYENGGMPSGSPAEVTLSLRRTLLTANCVNTTDVSLAQGMRGGRIGRWPSSTAKTEPK